MAETDGMKWDRQIPISWLNIQGYCEYKLFLREVKGIRPAVLTIVNEGIIAHEEIQIAHEKIAKELEEPIEDIIKKIPKGEHETISLSEFNVCSKKWGLIGRIDNIHILRGCVAIYDFKPGPKVSWGAQRQLKAYALAFKEQFHWDKEINIAVSSYAGKGDDWDPTQNVIWDKWYTSEDESEVIAIVQRLRGCFEGKRKFQPTSKPGKCKTCEYRDICSMNLINNSQCINDRKTIEDHNNAIELERKNNSSACYTRGVINSKTGNFLKAIEDFSGELDLSPNDKFGYFERGNAYKSLKEYPEAIDDYNKTVFLDPNFGPAYHNRGLVYYDIQNYQNAIKDFTKTLEMHTNEWKSHPCMIYIHHGVSYLQVYDNQKRNNIKNVVRTLSQNPREAYITRGKTYVKIGEYGKAIEDFSRVIQYDPTFFRDFILRGHANLLLKNYRKAIDDYNTAIKLNPNAANAYRFRGHALQSINRIDEAEADRKKYEFLKKQPIHGEKEESAVS